MAEPSEPSGRSAIDAIVELGKYAMDREKGTVEGRINTLMLLLATILLVTSPLWASAVGAEWGNGGGSIDATVGDNVGGVAWIISGGLACVLIVAGTNLLRRRLDGKNADDKKASNSSD
jgi:hypothetical protein